MTEEQWEEIGYRLACMRRRARLSTDDVANHLGISPIMIGFAELGVAHDPVLIEHLLELYRATPAEVAGVQALIGARDYDA